MVPSVLQASIWGRGGDFSASLPLLALVKNISLVNPSLDPACTGGGFTPWLACQGMVEASTHGSADASLLAQQLDGRLELVESIRTDAHVRLAAILSVEKALHDLGTFAFVALHLFSAGGRH